MIIRDFKLLKILFTFNKKVNELSQSLYRFIFAWKLLDQIFFSLSKNFELTFNSDMLSFIQVSDLFVTFKIQNELELVLKLWD